MSRPTYTAVCERADGWWAVHADPAPNRHVVTQVPRLGQAESMARDAIALLLEVPPESFDVVIDVRLPAATRRLLDRAAELRKEALLASEAASQAVTEAARALLSAGLTMREAGQVLGLSHQRVNQIVHRPRATA